MREPENRSAGFQRSRRNVIKIAGIAASAALSASVKATPADAVCANALGCNCFLKGTMIQTADGARRIEDLAVGDLLPAVFGGMRPVQWIARYSFKKDDPARTWVKDVLPVRVARSALGPGIPHADLYVTQMHALFIDGVLVPVCNLINGTTIAVYDAPELDELEYFHIKLEQHDVIHAEGVPCETLLEVDENAVNFAEYLRRYGPATSQATPCAAVVGAGRRVELTSRLRSAISPWIDLRQKLDIIRDKLEEGEEIDLLRQPELMA